MSNKLISFIKSANIDTLVEYMVDNKITNVTFLSRKCFVSESHMRKVLLSNGIDIKELHKRIKSDINNQSKAPTTTKVGITRVNAVKELIAILGEKYELLASPEPLELDAFFHQHNCNTWDQASELLGIPAFALKSYLRTHHFKFKGNVNTLPYFVGSDFIKSLLNIDVKKLPTYLKQNKCFVLSDVQRHGCLSSGLMKNLMLLRGQDIKSGLQGARTLQRLSPSIVNEVIKEDQLTVIHEPIESLVIGNDEPIFLKILCEDSYDKIVNILALKRCLTVAEISLLCETSHYRVRQVLANRCIDLITLKNDIREQIENDSLTMEGHIIKFGTEAEIEELLSDLNCISIENLAAIGGFSKMGFNNLFKAKKNILLPLIKKIKNIPH